MWKEASSICLERLRKTKNISVRNAGLRAGILTEDLPDMEKVLLTT
jgi:hypothetical protein